MSLCLPVRSANIRPIVPGFCIWRNGNQVLLLSSEFPTPKPFSGNLIVHRSWCERYRVQLVSLLLACEGCMTHCPDLICRKTEAAHPQSGSTDVSGTPYWPRVGIWRAFLPNNWLNNAHVIMHK